MRALRSTLTVALLGLMQLNFSSCRSPGEAGGAPSADPATTGPVELPGVDTSELTRREQREWSTYVTELLAPCADQPVNIAQCVKESRPCEACRPAAEFLRTQVRRGRTRAQAEGAFRVRFAAEEVKSIDLGDSPSKGPKDAVVTVVEWADYQCPHCAAVNPLMTRMLQQFPEHVRLVFKNYPLASHENAEYAARAAVAAGKQGKYWEMHELLFANQAKLTKDYSLFAKQLSLDMAQFIKDYESEAVADAVQADKKLGDKLGLQGTPMIYINGRHFTGGHFDYEEDLTEFIQLEIKLRTGKDVAPKPVPKGAAAAPSGEPADSGDLP
ncbi:MAG: thioredoxin domain-containing protein [Polyangiaceae bacterium]|nr:thioredoxin domain-containing protein [Polyangiaceae bacterium]MCW5792266.1 thioredoxin domain-containing protein [Polyangiaceae bacterium]